MSRKITRHRWEAEWCVVWWWFSHASSVGFSVQKLSSLDTPKGSCVNKDTILHPLGQECKVHPPSHPNPFGPPPHPPLSPSAYPCIPRSLRLPDSPHPAPARRQPVPATPSATSGRKLTNEKAPPANQGSRKYFLARNQWDWRQIWLLECWLVI